ncbi:MAG: DUF1016 N-terminal domain-containing protein [Bacteroidota bacterium]
MDYKLLVKIISQTHYNLLKSATKAINQALTIRNWVIGLYIIEFEQKGEDRAAYGLKLLQTLAGSLNHESMSYRNLKIFRQFYLEYPQIGQTVVTELKQMGLNLSSDISTLSNKQLLPDFHNITIGQTASAQFGDEANTDDSGRLISRLSFSHFTLLIQLNDNFKRRFYEIECIKGNWSVRELKRQINSLYFERGSMSRNNAMSLLNLRPMKSNMNISVS